MDPHFVISGYAENVGKLIMDGCGGRRMIKWMNVVGSHRQTLEAKTLPENAERERELKV